MIRRAALPLVAWLITACAPPPPAPDPATPVVTTEPAPPPPPAAADPVIAEAGCPAGQQRTDDGRCASPSDTAANERADERADEPAPPPAAKGPFPTSTHPAMTNPQLAKGQAPPHFAVRFDTTVGTFTVKCDRSWAPHGADRFYNLVSIGYFDDVAFFRAVKGFVVQFGIHGDPAVNTAWKKANLTPDVVTASNDEGTLTFAQAGRPAAPGKTADSRSVQLFFNLADNTRLDAMGFAPLCKVTSGMDVVKSIHTGHGEKAGRDQSNIQAQGNPYLRMNYPGLDYIERARLVGP